ncbi:MAG: nuclear transport factor 2 family protein [Erythrobacter sp.]|nr:nuclear transport factor 2 family protein [Erythrobacter sp.]
MRILTVGASALALANCAPHAGDPFREAEAAFGQYVAAINAGDSAAIADMYDDNPGFHWVERGGVQYTTGREATASFEELIASGSNPRMTTDDMQVAVLVDGSALVSTHFDLALLDAAGTEQFAFDGWMTVGMVKREDGWKIAGGQTGPGEEGD